MPGTERRGKLLSVLGQAVKKGKAERKAKDMLCYVCGY